MNAAERATKLVTEWTRYATGRPITMAVARLGNMVASAIQDAERDVYELAALTPASRLQALVALAAAAGAEGVWLVREVKSPALIFNVEGQTNNDYLDIIDARLIFVASFPDGDGGEAGIEFHAGSPAEGATE
jgi:hypothetical protein